MFNNLIIAAWLRLALALLAGLPGLAQDRVTGADGQPLRDKGQRQLRLFPLFHASYEDIAIVAQEFLSPDGSIRHVASRNSVVVIDYPENLAQVAIVVAALEGETPAANIRIEVTFDQVGEKRAAAVEVDPGWPVTIRNGKVQNPSITIAGGAGSSRHADFTSQQILTRDSHEASIWVGETVQEPMWVYEYGRRQRWWQTDYAQYDFGASLWVKPRLLANGLIEISVYPRVTARGAQPLSIDVKELTVTVLAQDGQTVTLGGLDQAQRDAYRKIIGLGRAFNGSTLTITMKPTVQPLAATPPATLPD